jgi:hypothetical protein
MSAHFQQTFKILPLGLSRQRTAKLLADRRRISRARWTSFSFGIFT